MSHRKSRSFRPHLDRLEPICLMSAGMRRPAMMRAANGIVNLRRTKVGRDVLAAVSRSTMKFSRDKIVLNGLMADQSAGTIRGGVAVTYKFGLFAKVTSNITFVTSIEDPRPGDVKVNLDNFNSFLTTDDRVKVANAVARALRADHDRIVGAFPAR